LNTKNSIEALEAGNYNECFRILLKYYDKHYLKALHNRDKLPALLQVVNCATVTIKNSLQLSDKHQTV